jgi:hypothetical protein
MKNMHSVKCTVNLKIDRQAWSYSKWEVFWAIFSLRVVLLDHLVFLTGLSIRGRVLDMSEFHDLQILSYYMPPGE